MRRANSRRFIDAKTGEVDPELVQALVHRDFDAAEALEAGSIAEGQIWVNGILAGARLAKFELTGSILNKVNFDRANARMMKAAGVITRDTSFGGIVAPESWFPGSVHINPNLTRANIAGGNWPGVVLVDPLLSGINAEETNLDGSLIVSETDQPALKEQANGRLKVLPAAKLAPAVREILREAQMTLASPRKRRSIEPATAEIVE